MENFEPLHKPFVVDETPYCMWELEIEKRNEKFINAINPEYFDFVADTYIDVFDNSKDTKIKTNAALALRMHYSLCLETMFSLILASIQAPHCLSGWLLKYQQPDLLKLIQKISDGKKIYSGFYIDEFSWQKITQVILLYFRNNENYSFLSDNFTYTLKNFADEYLDKDFRAEYNSLKHGFRNIAGGFSVTFNPHNQSESINLKGSGYGSSFLFEEKLTSSVNFRVIPKRFNWHPENLYAKSKLASLMIYNIKTFLLFKNNIRTDALAYKFFEQKESYVNPWEDLPDAITFSLSIWPPGFTPKVNKEDVLDLYKQDKKSES